jgi:hypothetical protein
MKPTELENDRSLSQSITPSPPGRCLLKSEEKIKHEKFVVWLIGLINLVDTKGILWSPTLPSLVA